MFLILLLFLILITINNWKHTIDQESLYLQLYNKSDFTKLHLNKDIIGWKWVFKGQLNSDGSIESHKTKNVAKEYIVIIMIIIFVVLALASIKQ